MREAHVVGRARWTGLNPNGRSTCSTHLVSSRGREDSDEEELEIIALLHQALSRILKRPLIKNDVQYQHMWWRHGTQCTLSMPALPSGWAQQAWAGEVCTTRSEARERAARYAYQAFLEGGLLDNG